MAKHYVTFGAIHTYRLEDGTYIDKDTVVRFDIESPEKGREKAFEIFGASFAFEYSQDNWNEDNMKYFRKGYIDLDVTKHIEITQLVSIINPE